MINRLAELPPTGRAILSIAVGAVVLTTVTHFAVLRPAHAAWRAEALVAEQAQEQARQVRGLEAQLADAEAALAETLATLDQQRIDLGDASQLNQRIASLIELAQEQGLEVAQLQPGGERTAEHYRLLSLQLEAVALPDAHAAFLERLHARFPDMSVVSLDLNDAKGRRPARPRGVFQMVWFTALDSAVSEPTDTAASPR